MGRYEGWTQVKSWDEMCGLCHVRRIDWHSGIVIVMHGCHYCILGVKWTDEAPDIYVEQDELEPYWAVMAGIIDGEQYEKCEAEDRVRRNEQIHEWERQQYLILKAKFERE